MEDLFVMSQIELYQCIKLSVYDGLDVIFVCHLHDNIYQIGHTKNLSGYLAGTQEPRLIGIFRSYIGPGLLQIFKKYLRGHHLMCSDNTFFTNLPETIIKIISIFMLKTQKHTVVGIKDVDHTILLEKYEILCRQVHINNKYIQSLVKLLEKHMDLNKSIENIPEIVLPPQNLIYRSLAPILEEDELADDEMQEINSLQEDRQQLNRIAGVGDPRTPQAGRQQLNRIADEPCE